MVPVTLEEATLLRKQFPNVCITIVNKFGTAKQKGRFVEEASAVMAALAAIREKSSAYDVRQDTPIT